MYRKTYAEIDLDALKENIKNIKNNYEYKYYIGVVKANAYGHGDYVINALIEGGINYLAASSLEECLSIRERNKTIKILCLEPINVEYLHIASEKDITITVPDLTYLKKIDQNLKLTIHIKIDSGMNRLGIKDKNELKEVCTLIKGNNNFNLEGIYTHFATSGIWDKYWDNSLEKFKEITSTINLKEIPIVHLGRSLTLVNHPKIEFANGIRTGIVMYGFAQSLKEPTGLKKFKRDIYLKKHNISKTTLTNNLKLNTAFKLYSEIMHIKYVKKGEFVGYGAKYIAKENMYIGIIPIGFADGFIKQNEGRFVTINNKKYEVIGEIGMDMTTIKIDDTVKLHDKVLLYNEISKEAHQMGLSSYTLLTSVTNRVPRVYVENNKKIEIKY